eukprot:GHVL01024860.1.p1 GENE.GHVL01024860.1~~GHVL01024860.1.p1  ORF type:complete len:278 (+),score=28.22 GHVL01024860.1:574-1407(+)
MENARIQSVPVSEVSFTIDPRSAKAIIGYLGDGCFSEIPCVNGCSNNGKCLANGSCQCYSGFTGSYCEHGQPKCLNNCSNRGTCDNRGKCQCKEGFAGNSCNIELNCPEGCCGHGKCSKGVCRCKWGWTGPSCSVESGDLKKFQRGLVTELTTNCLVSEDQADEYQYEQLKIKKVKSKTSPMGISGMTSESQQGKKSGLTVLRDMAYNQGKKIACDCSLHGECKKNQCFCEMGWEGTKCENKVEKFTRRKTIFILGSIAATGGLFVAISALRSRNNQ